MRNGFWGRELTVRPADATTRVAAPLMLALLLVATLPATDARAEGIGEAVFVGGVVETLPALFDQVRPSVASDPSGARISLAVWEDHRSGDADIFAARIDSAGARLDPVGLRVATGSAVQSAPAVASGGGRFLVAWVATQDAVWQLLATRITTDGTILDDPPLELASENMALSAPAIGFDGSDFLVVWSDTRDRGARIYGTGVSAAGEIRSPGGEQLAHTGEQLAAPALAYGAGEYLLVWQADFREIEETDTTYTSNIGGQRLDPDTGPLGDPLVIARTVRVEVTPAAAFDGERFLVVWGHQRDAGTQLILGRAVTTEGQVAADSLSLGRLVSGQERGFRVSPAVSHDGANFFVTWSLSQTLQGLSGVAVTYTGGLPAVSQPVLLVDESTEGQSLSWDGAQYILAYSFDGVLDADIGGTLISAAEVVTGPTQVLSQATRSQIPAAAAFDGTGYFLVWEEQCGEGWEVRGARVSADGELLDPGGIDLLSGPCTARRYPTLTRGDDAYLMLWSEPVTVRSSIRAQLRGFAGDSLSPVLELSNGAALGAAPAATFDGERFFTAWVGTSDQTGMYGAYLQASADSLALAADPAILRESGFLTDPALALSGRDLFATWGDELSGIWGYWRISDVAQSRSIARATTPSAPRVVFDGALFTLLWEDDAGSVYAMRANRTGQAFDPGRVRLSARSAEGERPALLRDGYSTIGIWREATDSIWQLMGARFASDGTVPEAGRFTIADEFATQGWPIAAAGNDGEALLAYSALVVEDGTASLRTAARTWSQDPPAITLAIHQNPVVTSDIGVYLMPSEPLDSQSVYAYANGAPLALEMSDGERGIYRGAYRALATDVVTILAGGRDAVGNPGSATRAFSVGLVSPDTGAVFAGPYDRLTLRCPPGAIGQGACFMVLPEKAWEHAGPIDAEGSWAFSISPVGLDLSRAAKLSFRLPAEGRSAERAVWLERKTPAGWETVPARRSADGGGLSADLDRLGQFRVRWGAEAPPGVRPLSLRLGPEPFRTQLGIQYVLPRDGHVRLAVFDPTGRRVRTLADGPAAAGAYTRSWDGRDASGRRLGSGVYFTRLDLDGQSTTRRCLLVR